MGHAHIHGQTPVVEEHADAWHHHDPASEGVPQGEHAGIASTSAIGKWFVAIVVALIVVVLGVGVFAIGDINRIKAQQFERDAGVRLAKGYYEYRANSEQALGNYAPLGDKGYRLPIEKAMEKVAADYQARKGAAAQ